MNRNDERILRQYIRENLTPDGMSLNEANLTAVFKKGVETALSQVQKIMANKDKIQSAADELTGLLSEDPDGAKAVENIRNYAAEIQSAMEQASGAKPTNESRAVGVQRRRRIVAEYRAGYQARRRSRRRLDESVITGIATVMGLALSALTLFTYFFKGLAKLAEMSKSPKTAEVFEKISHTLHHWEEKVHSVIPNRASYKLYIKLQESENPNGIANLNLYLQQLEAEESGGQSEEDLRAFIRAFGTERAMSGSGEENADPDFEKELQGFQPGLKTAGRKLMSKFSKKKDLSKRSLTYEEFLESDEKKQCEKIIFSILLIPLLAVSAQGAAHGLRAAHSTLGHTALTGGEVVASGVKAAEIGAATPAYLRIAAEVV